MQRMGPSPKTRLSLPGRLQHSISIARITITRSQQTHHILSSHPRHTRCLSVTFASYSICFVVLSPFASCLVNSFHSLFGNPPSIHHNDVSSALFASPHSQLCWGNWLVSRNGIDFHLSQTSEIFPSPGSDLTYNGYLLRQTSLLLGVTLSTPYSEFVWSIISSSRLVEYDYHQSICLSIDDTHQNKFLVWYV